MSDLVPRLIKLESIARHFEEAKSLAGLCGLAEDEELISVICIALHGDDTSSGIYKMIEIEKSEEEQ